VIATAVSEKELLERFAKAKEEKEKQESLLKEAEAEFQKAKAALVEYLEDREADRTGRYEDLGFASLTKPKIRASVSEEFKEALFQFCRDKNRGDLVKESVHPMSLSSFLGELLEQREAWPEFVSFYIDDQVRYYPSKKK